MTFAERLAKSAKNLFEGITGGIKNAYSGYGNLIASSGLTAGSELYRYGSDITRNLGTGRFSSRLAEIAQRSAEEAYKLRQTAGRTGSGFTPGGFQTTKSGLFDTGKAVAYTYGLGKMPAMIKPAPLAMTGALAGGLSLYTKQPFSKSLGMTLGNMPYYSGFAGLTDPFFSKVLTPFKSQLASRGVAGLANVGQGIGMDVTSGMPTTPTSLGIDLLSGLALGKASFATGFDDFSKMGMKSTKDILKDKKFEVKSVSQVFSDKFQSISKSNDYWDLLQKKGWDKNKIYGMATVVEGRIKEGDIRNPKGFMMYMLRKTFPKDEIKGTKTIAEVFLDEAKLSKAEKLKADRVVKEIKANMEAKPVTQQPSVKGELYDVFKQETGIRNYDDILRGSPSGADVGKSARVVMMSPDDYLRQIPKTKPSKSSLDLLRKQVNDGKKLGMPSLEFDDAGKLLTQEGRNRAYLAKELGIKEMPVLNVTQQPSVKGEPKIDKPIEVGQIISEVVSDKWKSLKSIRKGKAVDIKTPEQYNRSIKEHVDVILEEFSDLRSLFRRIDQEADGKQHFANIIRGKEPPRSPVYEQAYTRWKEYADKMAGAEGLSDIDKYRRNYLAAISNEQVYSDQIDDVFGSAGISSEMLKLPHLKRKTNPDWIGDASLEDTLDFRTKAGVLNAHKGVPLDVRYADNEALGKLVKNIESEKEAVFDYITEFGKEKTKEIKYKLSVLGRQPTRIDASIMRKINIEDKTDDLMRSFRKIRDSSDLYRRGYDRVLELARNEDIDGMIKYAQKLHNIKDVRYYNKARQLINKIGLENYGSVALKRAYQNKPIDNFVKVLGKYDVKDGTTKEYLNEFVDRHVKEAYYESRLHDKVLDHTVRWLSRAHIGGNIVTALKQPLETTKLPFLYGLNNTIVGWKDAITGGKNLDAKYGLREMGSNYMPLRAKYEKSLAKEAFERLDNILFKPLMKMEHFKNRVFVATIENMALKKGMTGQELTDFVRDELFQYGAIAHKYSTPVIMKDSSVARALGQYTQFSIKNWYAKVDAVQEKELGKLFGLLASDVINAGAISATLGYPLIWTLSNIMPVGTPPIFDIARDSYNAISNLMEAIENETSTDAPMERIKKLAVTNLMPGGVQGYRTAGYIQNMLRGYTDTPTGRVKHPVDKPNVLGLLAGEYATPESKAYYKDVKSPLGEVQSEDFKELLKIDKAVAKTFYDDTIKARLDEKAEKKEEKRIIASVLDGEIQLDDPGLMQELETRQSAVTELYKMGIDDPYEIGQILDQRAKDDGHSGSSYSINEIKAYSGLAESQRPLSVIDIIQKKQALSDVRSGISRIMENKDEAVQKALLQSKGYTQKDLRDWIAWKFSNTPAKDRANWIISSKNTDFVSLYKDEILTSKVAEELELKGYIPSAEDLMEKLKMTDPYYAKKFQKDLKVKHGTKLLRRRAKTIKDMLEANVKYHKNIRKLLLEKPKRKAIQFYTPKPSASGLPKPTAYKVKKPPKLKVNYNL